VLRIVRVMKRYAPGVPLVAQPNAGGPQRMAGRIMYSATPEYFGDYAASFIAEGVWLIGGCCGSTPAHIRAMAAALAAPAATPPLEVSESPPEPVEALPLAPPTRFQERLASDAFTIAVEMEPPRGFSAARLVAGAGTLREAGADVINVSDSPMAKMRMSPWAACHLVQQDAGIEAVLNFPTRGRNLLRIQGDLLAAYALGIRNIFAVMGDSTRIGDFPEAADLADVTPSGLIALIKGSLNEGTDRSGASIGNPTSFVVGCAVNINAADLEREARVLKRKIDAGADYALSQAVFDPGRIGAFRELFEQRHGSLELPILAGLLPLASGRHAEFLHNEVPGIDIPDEVRKRIAHAADERAEGIEIALELARSLREQVAGLYMIPPFRRYDLAAELLERIRADDREGAR